MLLQTLFSQVGSYIVPLVIAISLGIFAVTHIRRFDQYMEDKRDFRNAIYFSELCVGYMLILPAAEKYSKKFFWRYFFAAKYATLVESYLQRLVYELDRLEQFSWYPYSRSGRTELVEQWQIIDRAVFFQTIFSIVESNGTPHKVLTPKNPFVAFLFGPFNEIFQEKVSELFRKQALLLLRKEGYSAFSEFLQEQSDFASQYPPKTPFSKLQETINRVICENEKEAKERINKEFLDIIKEGRRDIQQQHRMLQALENLRDTYVLTWPHIFDAQKDEISKQISSMKVSIATYGRRTFD